MSGHIFIVRGDIRQLACDAWLIPCSRNAQPVRFLPDHRQQGAGLEAFPPWPIPDPSDDWWTWGRRSLRVEDWPTSEPQPWLVNVGYNPKSGVTSDDFYRRSVKEALREVFASLGANYKPKNRRQVPLMALPFLGGRWGMRLFERGQLLRLLLSLIHEELERIDHTVDVALVTFGAQQFAAAQHERMSLGHGWPSLDSALQEQARRLGDQATRENLALFCGAGIGVGAGLPTWNELLRAIAVEAGMLAADIQNLLDQRRDVRDQASYLQTCLGTPEKLHQTIVAILTRKHHYSLSHALLAGLPVREVITTNYDQLFEWAWDGASAEAVGKSSDFRIPVCTAILPHALKPNADRWLLKLHGCVSQEDSIVLTRESYIRYNSQWAALEGILQATLLTRHMLFVGFSLRDDNFMRILDAVRRVVRPATSPSSQPFGTALMMGKDDILQRLFQHDLQWMPMSGLDEWQMQGADYQQPGRQLELFLDCLLAHTRSFAHLLDQDFREVLTRDEQELSRMLQELVNAMPPRANRSPAWERLEAFLRGLGWRGSSPTEEQ